MEPKITFTKIRSVLSPRRAHTGDAGLDFYVPTDLTFSTIKEVNKGTENVVISNNNVATGCVKVVTEDSYMVGLVLGPQSRIKIPSGIKVLLEPSDSMLKVANKSGISNNKGLIYTAEIVDSPYTGEVNICIMNPTSCAVTLGKEYFDSQNQKAIVQLIHMPIYLTEPEEVGNEVFNGIAESWGTRGENGFGSETKD